MLHTDTFSRCCLEALWSIFYDSWFLNSFALACISYIFNTEIAVFLKVLQVQFKFLTIFFLYKWGRLITLLNYT